jgi:hypothetical protein
MDRKPPMAAMRRIERAAEKPDLLQGRVWPVPRTIHL